MNDEMKAPAQGLDCLMAEAQDYDGLDFFPSKQERDQAAYENLAAYTLKLLNYFNSLPSSAQEGVTAGCTEIAELDKALREKMAKGELDPDTGTENILGVQAHILDAVFSRTLQRCYLNNEDHFSVNRMRIALMAQRQCGHTIGTLKKIKKFEERSEENGKCPP